MAFARLTSALSGLETSMDKTASRLREHAASIRSSVAEAETAVRGAETRIAEGLDRAREKARQRSEEISSLVDSLLTKTGNQFDDLRNMLENASGPFADELQKQLDLLELAGTSVEEIGRLFGDAVIEGKKLREILQGADFRQFEQDVQKLMQALRRGALEVDELLKFLNQRGGDFGKTVAQWIEALKKGEISLERFQGLIAGLQEQFEGTDFESFLGEIEDAIEGGRI